MGLISLVMDYPLQRTFYLKNCVMKIEKVFEFHGGEFVEVTSLIESKKRRVTTCSDCECLQVLS